MQEEGRDMTTTSFGLSIHWTERVVSLFFFLL